MPKVNFVVEHQCVDVAAGRRLRAVALDAGIYPNREFLRGVNCGGRGICGTCKVWVNASSSQAVSPPNLREKIHGAGAGRRLACQTEVLGDIEVTTMPGGDDRLDRDRSIGPTPTPVQDPSAIRKPIDEASSIAYPLGHPSAVGNRQLPEPESKELVKSETKPAASKAESPRDKATGSRGDELKDRPTVEPLAQTARVGAQDTEPDGVQVPAAAVPAAVSTPQAANKGQGPVES